MRKGTCLKCFFLARLSRSGTSISLNSLPPDLRGQANLGRFRPDWDYVCFHRLWVRPADNSSFTGLLKRLRPCPLFTPQNAHDPTASLESAANIVQLSRNTGTSAPLQSSRRVAARKKDGTVYILKYEGMRLTVTGRFKTPDGKTVKRKYRLAKPDLDSENDIVISFLLQNSNKKFSRESLQAAIRSQGEDDFHLKKPFSKIAENLGFKKEFRVFMRASKTSIILRNPITREDLKPLGITYLSLPS